MNEIYIFSIITISLLVIEVVFLRKKIYMMEKQFEEEKKKSLNSSRRVIKGKISEEIAPLLPGFPYNISDVKFFGQPIDVIIFKNMSEVRDDSEGEITIVFGDIKTGNARLTKVQKKIKEAVEAGRVKWETITLNYEEKN